VIRRDAAPYALFLLVAIVVWLLADRIDFYAPPGRIGPDIWPKAIALFLGVVCTIETLRRVLGSAKNRDAQGLLQTLLDRSGEGDGAPPGTNTRRLLLGIGAVAGFVLLVGVIGFVLTTALFIAAFAIIGGYRRYGVVMITALVGALLLTLLFQRVVYLSLPIGVGPFATISLGILAALGVR
jgi:putative tricarboxylic transport membrane protein